jgi:hypothetical protein
MVVIIGSSCFLSFVSCVTALNMRQPSAPVTAPHRTPKRTRRRVNWSMTTSTQ